MPWDGSRAPKEERLLLFPRKNSGKEKSWTLFTIALPYYFFPSIKAFFFPCYVGPCTWLAIFQFSSVQFSCSFISDSLWPHGLHHARLPCPSPTPRVHSDSCLLSRWCHPTISSSVIPFSCLQSFTASGFSNESVLHIRWFFGRFFHMYETEI